MADRPPVTWAHLTPDAREVFAWARACETGRDVGTRALIVGLVRRAPGDNVVEHVLRSGRFDIDVDRLFDTLVRQARPAIDPWTELPVVLGDLPVLTPNAVECLTIAARLAQQSRRDLDTVVLFGAVLAMARGTGARALELLLGRERLGTLREVYLDWLRGPGGSLTEALGHAFAFGDAGGSSAGTEDASSSSERPRLPRDIRSRMVIIRGAAGPDLPLADTGLGLLTERDTVVTTAPQSDHELAVAVTTGRQAGVTTVDRQSSRIRVLRSREPHFPRVDPELSPPARRVEPGERFVVPFVRTGARGLYLANAVTVAVSGDGEGAFGLLVQDLPADVVVVGAPVVDERGAVAGLVVERGSPGLLAIPFPPARSARSAPAGPATGSLLGAANDAVGSVDQLGFAPYVSAFADLITSPHTTPPLTIGIFGQWGTGKSFLLTNIEREIARRQEEETGGPRVHVVHFNAWEYSASEVVWPGLVRKIISTLDGLSTWPRHKRVWERVRWNVRRQWGELSRWLIAIALVLAATFAVALVKGEGGIAGAVGAVTALLTVGGLVKAARDPVAQWITALFAERDYGRHLGVMEDIRHDLERLETRLHGSDGDDEGRVLVLIDDLDRCEPAKAVEVLQAVNLLLNFPSFVVCLGIDARIITNAVENHYGGLLGEAGASGYEYLDKIVQIPFRIPEPSAAEIVRFVAHQLGDPLPGERAAAQQGEEPARTTARADVSAPSLVTDGPPAESPTERAHSARPPATLDRALTERSEVAFTHDELAAFERVAGQLRPNPRHLKRVVNVYRLVRALARSQGETVVLDSPAATIRWLVMWSQWPYTSLMMLEHLDTLPDDADPGGDGDPLLHLLDAVEESLDPATRAELDDSPARLRALLAVEGCDLTWDQLRAIRRYTVNFNPAVEERLR